MIIAIHLGGLALCFALGIVCIRAPMRMANPLAAYAQLIFGSSFSKSSKNSRLREALQLMKENPSEYQERYALQIMIIRQTGYVAVFVSTIGACILILGGR
jgi:hypothetical protein